MKTTTLNEQHRFGVSPPLSLGAGTPIANQVSVEIFTEQIELKTGICRDAGEVFEQLRELRRNVGQAGFGLLGCGLHPTAAGESVLVAKPRYELVQKDLPAPFDHGPGGGRSRS